MNQILQKDRENKNILWKEKNNEISGYVEKKSRNNAVKKESVSTGLKWLCPEINQYK